MNSNSVMEFHSEPIGIAASSATQPFYWSLRRELWENRSLYLAPLIVAAVQIFGFAVSTHGLAERRRAVMLLDPGIQRLRIGEPYDVTAMMMIFTVFIVAIFYCLDALYGERRDRSILFWKSLPVSDLTSVLAKATVALAILPVITFLVVVCTHIVILIITSLVLAVHGVSPATTWAHYSPPFDWLVLSYGLIAIALWQAPIYGWFLFVSSWVRRAAFLWAVLPFVGGAIFERITFGTTYFVSFLKSRFFGFAPEAFDFRGQSHPIIDSLAQLTPARYLTSAGLWVGLILTAGLLAATVRLRRSQGPI